MSSLEIFQLVKTLVEITRKGPAGEWIQRIYLIAQELDLSLESICWQGSPEIVASRVVLQAERSSVLDKLEKILAEKIADMEHFQTCSLCGRTLIK